MSWKQTRRVFLIDSHELPAIVDIFSNLTSLLSEGQTPRLAVHFFVLMPKGENWRK
jgi:hypothetical protein